MTQTSSQTSSQSASQERSSAAPAAEAEQRLFSGRGFSLGQLFGVHVQVDWSLLIIFVLITVNLGVGVFPVWHPEWSPALVWGLSIAAAILFFASVLAHEMAHALVARTQGIPIRRITLFLFGGVSHMEAEPRSPKAEFAMAIVGPLASILIGVVATFLGVYLAGDAARLAAEADTVDELQAAVSTIGPGATLLLWLGPINILLGIFNTIPGFPLDGGRVLRSILWGITGDLVKATRWASGVGQLFAWLLMAAGVMYFFAGALAQGLWLLLIGWFLNNAARMSYQQLLIHQALEHVPVGRIMRTQLHRVAPTLSLEAFVREHLMATDQYAFPVESNGVLVGLVTLDDVRKVPQSQWAETNVEWIMTPVDQLSGLPPDAGAEVALTRLAQTDEEQLPIIENRRLVGLVRRSDLLKWLALQGDVAPSPLLRRS